MLKTWQLTDTLPYPILQGVGLIGTLPNQVSPMLRHVYLDGNNLTGTLPPVFATLEQLNTLSLSNNMVRDLPGVLYITKESHQCPFPVPGLYSHN